MTGRAIPGHGALSIVGLGPGGPEHRTAAAEAALREAGVLLGYAGYLDRLPPCPGQSREATDNRAEAARAEHALALAVAGERVALVSGGDPGVFAMASAVMEAIEHGPDAFRDVAVEVVPGVTAMLAAASRLGAPLGHDFCALSLSDNLKPWPVVLRRLLAAAEAGFAIAIYNPRSAARPWQLDAALSHLRQVLPDATPIAFVAGATTPDERISIATLGAAQGTRADMRTIVIIGTEQSRTVERPRRAPLLYAPRHA